MPLSATDSSPRPEAAARPAPPGRRRLVVGYGNPLRGDDGAGAAAAQALAARVGEPAAEEVLATQQLLPEMSERLAAVGLALFLDASLEVPAGAVEWRAVRPAGGAPPLGHHAVPERLLALTEALHGRRPRAVVAHIGARRLDYGAGLSPEVRRAVERVTERLAGSFARRHSRAEPRRRRNGEP